MLSHVFCDPDNIFINLIKILELRRIVMPDAKEWEKAGNNLVKTKNWLYQFYCDWSGDPSQNEEIQIIRWLLGNAIEKLDKLAKDDDKGWFHVPEE